MKTKAIVPIFPLFFSAALLASLGAKGAPMGTAFTYQGNLASGTNAANGVYDFSFAAYDAASGGMQKGSTITTNAVPVGNGYFMVTLDFGNIFPGEARWLDISVKTNGAGGFTVLSPRQQLTPMPYAITAGSASNVLGTVPAVQLIGTVANGQLANSAVTVTAGTGLAGGGTIPLGGSATLNNAGVLSVTGNADIIAAPNTGNVGLGSTATDANTASRIVKRDASGNFSAGSITLAGNLNLPATTASSGAIYSGGSLLMHDYGSGNFFAGLGAGNLTMGGTANVGVGSYALDANTIGNYNIALGYNALTANTNGSYNTANGYDALFYNISGSGNTALGTWAMELNTVGSYNTAVGMDALLANTNGNYNTAVGYYAGFNSPNGNQNTALGYAAGYYPTNGNYNIHIGSYGTYADNHIIRVGMQGYQTDAFIAGIYGNTVTNGIPVYVDSNGQLGSSASSPVALLGANQTFTGVVNFNNAGNTFVGNSSGLTSLTAANLTGTIADARLSANVAKLNANQTFTGTNQFASQLIVNSGPIDLSLYTGLALQYYASGEGAIMSSYNDGYGYLTFYTKQGSGYPIAKQMMIDRYGGVAIDQQDFNNGTLNHSGTNGIGLTFGVGSGEGLASKRTTGGNQYGLDFYTGFANRMSISQGGNIAINGNALLVNGVGDTGNGLQFVSGLPGNIPGGAGPLLFGWNGGALGSVGPTEVSLSWDFRGNVWVSNNCSVATLSVRGGADLAEPFEITGTEVSEGAVVVIDEQNPGHLKVSDSPYDTHVAGVVSGAKGINPGIQMHQQGLLDGGRNVALSGRVYVQADASSGAIQPGDMLTTSSTPGYAMKVTNHANAQGAILGKAMTGLSEGKGMVLVLVTLQ